MFQVEKLGLAILLAGLCLTASAFAAEDVTHKTVNEKMGYQSSSEGEPLSDPGAQVTISAAHADKKAYGGIIYRTSSRPWVNKLVQLSALVTSTPGAMPAIWLRADGSSGKPLRFVTSADSDAPTDGHLSVDLRIPPDATSVAFGVVMHGRGSTTAKGLKLVETEDILQGSSASAKQVYDAALQVVLENAYWASNLSKNLFDSKPELSGEAGSGYQAQKAIKALLRELKDSHSFYQSAEVARHYSKSGGDPGAAEVKLMDGGVGYVSVPTVPGSNRDLAKKFADQIGRQLKDLNGSARCGWIVDLRKNRGGSMWPMISALSIFFDEERLGGFKYRNGDINWWSIQSPLVTFVSGVSDAKDARIAVLLGPRTSSSGEATALAFIGRKDTRSFGALTSGQASSNRKFTLPDSSAIYLTTGIDVDRSGHAVGARIVPDVLLPNDIVSDSAVPQDAMAWLTSSCIK